MTLYGLGLDAGVLTRPRSRGRGRVDGRRRRVVEALLPFREVRRLLDERELRILEARYFAAVPPSYRQLGHRFGITGNRVRQIEEKAIRRLFGRPWVRQLLPLGVQV